MKLLSKKPTACQSDLRVKGYMYFMYVNFILDVQSKGNVMFFSFGRFSFLFFV